MSEVIVLPKIIKLHEAKADLVNNALSLIFEAEGNQCFQLNLTPEVAAHLLPAILERSPKPDIEPMSFSSPVANLKTAIDEDGHPLIGLFFQSSLPVTVRLTDETISLLKHALTDLETKVGVTGNAKH